MLHFKETHIQGCYVIEQGLINDERGHFAKIFCENIFKEKGLNSSWSQLNTSISTKSGTLRGPHMQLSPFQEVKLIKCDQGVVWDVVIDMREDSKSYLSWLGTKLSSKDNTLIYIPKGCAHGVLSLEDKSSITYLSSEPYDQESEITIRWDDPSININWPAKPKIISEKDTLAPYLNLS